MVIKRPRFIQSQSSSQVYIWLDAHVYQAGMTITSHSNITSRLIPWGGWKLFHFVNGNPDGLKLLYKLKNISIIYIHVSLPLQSKDKPFFRDVPQLLHLRLLGPSLYTCKTLHQAKRGLVGVRTPTAAAGDIGPCATIDLKRPVGFLWLKSLKLPILKNFWEPQAIQICLTGAAELEASVWTTCQFDGAAVESR